MEAIIFIGIQVVRKFTFTLGCFSAAHVRIKLNMLKTRPRTMTLLQACISARQPVVVDNTHVVKRRCAGDKDAYYAFIGGLIQES